jgi:hypothetical protein
MNKYVGRVCEKHPDGGGERYENGTCVKCQRERIRECRKKRLQGSAELRAEKRKKYLPRRRERYASDPEYRLKIAEKKAIKHKEKMASDPGYVAERKSYHRLRQSRMTKAMPPWADKGKIRAIYEEAARLGLSVDHIIPLKHPLVCGLHTPDNLQLMPLKENISKNNQFKL